jgi:hypothetical protein
MAGKILELEKLERDLAGEGAPGVGRTGWLG